MSDTGNFVLRVRKFRYERAIDVDNDKTTLITDVQFNDHDGTSSVTQKQTTKAMSRNAAARAAVSQQMEKMREEGVTLCLALEKEWKINSGDYDPDDEDGLGNMRRGNKDRYEKSVDQAMLDEHGITWDEERGYLNPDGTPFNPRAVDSDGGSDDEHNPEEKKLTFDAPPKEARPRKPRSNAAPVEV